jgi:hypothetical protein
MIYIISLLEYYQGINVDHGINVDQHSKPQNKGKYSIYCTHTCCVVLSVDLHEMRDLH